MSIKLRKVKDKVDLIKPEDHNAKVDKLNEQLAKIKEIDDRLTRMGF